MSDDFIEWCGKHPRLTSFIIIAEFFVLTALVCAIRSYWP